MIKFIKEVGKSFSAYISALRFINQNKMWPYIIGAAFFNLFAFIFVGIVAWLYTGNLIDWLYSFMNLPPDWKEWTGLVQIALSIFIRILLFLIYLNLFKYIILFIFAPVLAFISEKTQNILHKESRTLKLHHVVRDIIRGMFIAIILISLQVVSWLLLVLLCISLPLLAPFYAILLFLIESFFFGASMMDYRNEYFGLSVKESLIRIFRHKGIAFGNGFCLNLLILIPVLGVLFGPSLAVISAAIASNRTLE
ncbi:EI24 domain-containing protein [Marivirga sp. S37H4]|uniref:EI24 domain-containing protein n=1 Tax=Marivirga aurantiaca TaxID=2802615 RepID=A0A934WWD4_9BACT|nr:EI24 domain-containing protein [Marivirga aurantiaca]MBK6264157.1 EI24 domain-containing protein [Marivirga aurantiaca]